MASSINQSAAMLINWLTTSPVQDGKPRRSSNSPGLDGISAMLTLYQEAVRSLLSQSDYPGVSAEELELFKNQFRTSAFTCRLNSCPRATLGFESEKLRLEHEMAHVRRFRCTFPGCKYPPFVSAQSLTNHSNKYHNPNPPRKSIRRVGHIPMTRSGNAAGLTTQSRNSSILSSLQDSGDQSDQRSTRELHHTTPHPSSPQVPGHHSVAAQDQSQLTLQTHLLSDAANVGNSLGELDPSSLPQHLKREGNDWFAVFNPRVQRVLDVDLVHTLTHQSMVCCVRFSLDGRFVATSCKQSAQIFDVNTGNMVALLQDSSLPEDGDLYIRSVCFSPDGKYLATGAEDGVIRVSSSSSLFLKQVLIAIRSGIFKTVQSNFNLPYMIKISPRSTLPATVVGSLQGVATAPCSCGTLRQTSECCTCPSTMVLAQLQSLQTTAMLRQDRWTGAFVCGIRTPASSSSGSGASKVTWTVSTRWLLLQMAETLSAVVWTRRSRCGSSPPQPESTLAKLQEPASALGLSRATR